MPSSSSSGADLRQVPLSIRAAILTHGPIRQFGWLFVLVGALIMAFTIPSVDLRFSAYDAHTTGEVTRVERTSTRVNRRPIYRVEIQVTIQEPRTVHSYTPHPPQPGDEVRVNYDSDDPADACMEGARRGQLPPWILVVLVFPALGLFFALRRLGQARTTVRLLRQGRPAHARVTGKRPGVDSFNDVPETHVRLEFEDEAGATHELEVATFKPQLLGDDPREVVFYDASSPA
ncbi:MAG TPA: DUF3592 domain-containing protein, partial [Kofleriaceae bacterium]|nr:DUF3592 domain-containing protein [Kofleriaceae bacterium]